jgi:MtN3 and saliva related transmembrane protein
MKHIIVLILGYASGVLTTFAGVPQVIQIIRTSSTKDLSYIGLSMTTSGLCLWTVYGFLEQDNPMIVTNLIAFFIYGLLLSMKVYIEIYKKKGSDITYSQLSTLQDGERV